MKFSTLSLAAAVLFAVLLGAPLDAAAGGSSRSRARTTRSFGAGIKVTRSLPTRFRRQRATGRVRGPVRMGEPKPAGEEGGAEPTGADAEGPPADDGQKGGEATGDGGETPKTPPGKVVRDNRRGGGGRSTGEGGRRRR